MINKELKEEAKKRYNTDGFLSLLPNASDYNATQHQIEKQRVEKILEETVDKATLAERARCATVARAEFFMNSTLIQAGKDIAKAIEEL